MTKQSYGLPDKEFIRAAFDSITPRYDFLNQVLSLGMAEVWRKRSAKILLSDPRFSPKTLLDLGCGTGKFLECFLRIREQQVPASVSGAQGPGVKGTWESMTGVDFSAAMLKKAHETVPGNVM